MIDTTAPVKNAKYRPATILGKDKKNPIIKDSFTSPNPIPLPFVNKKRRKNSENAAKADNSFNDNSFCAKSNV